MADLNTMTPSISSELVEAVKSLPVQREVRHCGSVFLVNPFDLYANCPTCGKRIKVRAFSGGIEIEDLFDAVFAWMSRSDAAEAARHRIAAIRNDIDE
jgi:hypothetical protein